MGKTSKWFRSLLSSKKSPESSPVEVAPPKKKNSKWALSKSADTSVKFKNVEDPLASQYVEGLDANKHAIAVAAATAAVAEAALAAAQAAAEVVRLTSGGGSGRTAAAYVSGDRRPVLAAVKIQSAFRAYLARRALKALKGLVKLQALVRGHIVRKQSTDMLRRMQAMARIQARASAHRSYIPESSYPKNNFSNSHHPGITNLRKYEGRSNSAKHDGSLLKQNHSRSRIGNNINKESSHIASNWLNHWMEQCKWNNLQDTSGRGDDERSDKILEIDTWKPRHNTKRNDRTFPTSQYISARNDIGYSRSNLRGPGPPNPSISSEEVSSLISQKFPPEGDDQVPAWAADNSPGLHSASSRPTSNLRGLSPFTPTRSLFGDYLGHPNYMTNTESSRAKVRSQSVPKQRMQFEQLGLSSSSKFGRGFWESDAYSEKGSVLPANHRSNPYLHSGHLKRQATPIRGGADSFSSMYGHRL